LYSIGIRINPRTSVFEAAVKEGVIKDASELLFARFYVSKDNVDWARKFIDQSIRKYAYRYRRMAGVVLRNIIDALI
jgi:hypothetical protein